MCTITLLAGRNGYALGMNRDEKLARVKALPPARHRLGGHEALFPSEPSGGTWIGVNDAGATLALVNWYSARARVTGKAISRGQVVRSAVAEDVPASVDRALQQLALGRINPFRLVGIFPIHHAVVEWRWNLSRLDRFDLPWQTHIWISSGFDEPGAQQTRLKTFREALRQKSAGRVDWLRRLHRSHTPEKGPYSICMHRQDAATVSYTDITVSGSTATLRYLPGPPCGAGPVIRHDLTLFQRIAPHSPHCLQSPR